MIENKSPPLQNPSDEAWKNFRRAFETLWKSIPASSNSVSGVKGPEQREEIQQMVTEAVSAVLLESDLIEKLVQRALQKYLKDAKGDFFESLFPKEKFRDNCIEILKNFSMQAFKPVLQNQLKEVISQKLTEFGSSEEFKMILDARFRLMEKYLRNDVLPQLIRNAVSA